MHKLYLCKNIIIEDRNVIFHYLRGFKFLRDIWIKIQGMGGRFTFSKYIFHEKSINDKEVIGGVSKEYIVKYDKIKKKQIMGWWFYPIRKIKKN